MMDRRWTTLFTLVALLLLGCGTRNVDTRHSTDLEARKIKRIAVLPPVEEPLPPPVPKDRSAATVAAERPSLQREAPETLAKLLYATMASMPNWQIVSESEVREVSQALRADASRLKQIGDRVYADAVITARVLRIRERVGDEWGIKSPASVGFVVDLVDVRRGDIVWSAHFDETQKSLTENLLGIGDIGQRGVRWLTAEQLMHEGVKKVAGQLHELIAR